MSKELSIKIEKCCTEFINAISDKEPYLYGQHISHMIYGLNRTIRDKSNEDMKIHFQKEIEKIKEIAPKYNLNPEYIYKIMFT